MKCCTAQPNEWVGTLKECMPIMTPHDPIFRRKCIPFLRSAPVPGYPGTKGMLSTMHL